MPRSGSSSSTSPGRRGLVSWTSRFRFIITRQGAWRGRTSAGTWWGCGRCCKKCDGVFPRLGDPRVRRFARTWPGSADNWGMTRRRNVPWRRWGWPWKPICRNRHSPRFENARGLPSTPSSSKAHPHHARRTPESRVGHKANAPCSAGTAPFLQVTYVSRATCRISRATECSTNLRLRSRFSRRGAGADAGGPLAAMKRVPPALLINLIGLVGPHVHLRTEKGAGLARQVLRRDLVGVHIPVEVTRVGREGCVLARVLAR